TPGSKSSTVKMRRFGLVLAFPYEWCDSAQNRRAGEPPRRARPNALHCSDRDRTKRCRNSSPTGGLLASRHRPAPPSSRSFTLWPVHPDGVAPVPIQRGLAHLVNGVAVMRYSSCPMYAAAFASLAPRDRMLRACHEINARFGG